MDDPSGQTIVENTRSKLNKHIHTYTQTNRVSLCTVAEITECTAAHSLKNTGLSNDGGVIGPLKLVLGK